MPTLTQVRSSATGIAGSIGYVFNSVANKVYLYMVNGMSMPGTFLFYALINFAGGVLLYFILPETEGRSLKEIEEHYAGIQSLRSRPRKEELAFKEKWAASNPAVVYDDTESKLWFRVSKAMISTAFLKLKVQFDAILIHICNKSFDQYTGC